MADLVTLRQRLTEAETARHNALTRGSITDVWRDGRRIRYSATDVSDLTAYIEELRQLIIEMDPAGPEATATTGRRRAVGVIFG